MRWPSAKIDELRASAPYSFVGGPFGSELTSRDYRDEGVPVIRGSNLSGPGSFNDHGFVFVSEEKADQLRSNLAYPGDLVFTQRGTLGQVGLIPSDAAYERYVVSQSQMKLTVDGERVDARFLYYFFRQPGTVQRLINLNSSSGVPHINLGALKAFNAPVPPLDEQLRIVDVAHNYDTLIENNRRRIALLEQAARLLYREWFVHLRYPGHEHVRVVNGVPEGWTRGSIEEHCETIGGGTPTTANPAFWEGDISWVVPTDVTRSNCLTLLDTERKITEAGLRASSARMLPSQAILMTSRASVGFFALPARSVCTNQGFISIIPKDPAIRLYLLHNLLERVEEIGSHAGGTTFPEISKSKFRALPLLLPPRTLAEVFESQAAPVHQMVRALALQNARLTAARDLLLPCLMSGEIAV